MHACFAFTIRMASHITMIYADQSEQDNCNELFVRNLDPNLSFMLRTCTLGLSISDRSEEIPSPPLAFTVNADFYNKRNHFT
jgi:hypothetical protein